MAVSPVWPCISVRLVAAAVAGMLLAGCGGAPVDAGTFAINGAVTLDGKPLDNAAVAFIGKEGARLATAQTNTAGKFTIRAAPGKNVVTVSKPSANPTPPSDEPQLMPSQGEYQKMVVAAKSEVPAKYGDPKTSGLSYDVTEAMKEVEIALSTK
jgi:hypothetical protein